MDSQHQSVSPQRTDTGHPEKNKGVQMHAMQVLTLFLALSGAMNTAFAAGITARCAGASASQAILTAAGAAGTVMAIFFTALTAYH
jgi:hypothetical protein